MGGPRGLGSGPRRYDHVRGEGFPSQPSGPCLILHIPGVLL
jgi:hypothetical protein